MGNTSLHSLKLHANKSRRTPGPNMFPGSKDDWGRPAKAVQRQLGALSDTQHGHRATSPLTVVMCPTIAAILSVRFLP